MKECVTHHYACDCREQKFKALEAEVERYKTALQKISEGGDHCGDDVDLMNIASKFLGEE